MEECSKYKGRLYDLCTGTGHDGRPNPTQDACNRFREQHGKELIVVQNPSAETPKKLSDGTFAVSSIGTYMETLIRQRIAAMPCSRCKQRILNLNAQTPEEAEAGREELIKEMKADAVRAASKWWLKVVAAADQFLHLGGTEYLLNWCLDDAIEMERNSKR